MAAIQLFLVGLTFTIKHLPLCQQQTRVDGVAVARLRPLDVSLSGDVWSLVQEVKCLLWFLNVALKGL